MTKTEKILKEICNTIRIRKDYYNEIWPEQKTPQILTSKLIYNDLYEQVSWLFRNIEEEDEKTDQHSN